MVANDDILLHLVQQSLLNSIDIHRDVHFITDLMKLPISNKFIVRNVYFRK